MKKKIIIILIVLVTFAIITMLISYIIKSTNSNINQQNNNLSQEKISGNSLESSQVNGGDEKDEYKNINIESELAEEIYDFLPKYFQIYENKMSNDYIIYSSICRLDEKQVPKTNYKFSDNENLGYSFELVSNEAKLMFGKTTEIKINEKYGLPIEYSSQENAFCLFPVSLGSFEEYQIIKEIKENSKSFILTMYALNIEYDINNLDNIFVSTKDTFELYKNINSSYEDLRSSMKIYKLSGIEVDPRMIINEFKSVIPLIEYELEKLDDRGTKYFVKNISLILDN